MLFDHEMLQTSLFSSNAGLQITLDNDFNVPDVKADIDKIIASGGNVHLQNIKIMKDRMIVKGALTWHTLYLRQQSIPESLEGELPFEEVINIDGLTEDARVRVDCEMEDLRITTIHSRKVSVRALVHLTADAREIGEIAAVTATESEDVYMLPENIIYSPVTVRKRDTVRIREEIHLPGNKHNMREILWGEVQLQHLDIRTTDGKLLLRGDAAIFVLYSAQNEENPFEYLETDLPWHAEVECADLKEEMIANTHLHRIAQSLEMKPDGDGEMRIVNMEIVLDMDMEASEEKQLTIVKDMYGLMQRIEPEIKDIELSHIFLRNQTECKLYEKILLPGETAGVLQICHPWAEVKLDRTEPEEKGIRAEGVVEMHLLYVVSDDRLPLDVMTKMMPFSCLIETGYLPDNYDYDVTAVIDQLGAVMTESDTAEVRAAVKLDTFIYEHHHQRVITTAEAVDIDENEIKQMANIIGYVVQEGDDLFSLGKKFCTTKEAIMQINEMENDKITVGDRLLIMKFVTV